MPLFLKAFLVSALGISCTGAAAGENDPGGTAAGTRDDDLELVQVTATRREVGVMDVAGAVGVVDMDQARAGIPGTIAESLRAQPGAYFQQTTPGQGIPIVRGLKGSQLLHLVDGMRLNNALFRDAPNQYLALVDPFALDAIEVLRGAAGSLYGADAMGGVVQLRSPELPLDAAAHVGGRFFGGWNSADNGRTLRADTVMNRPGAAMTAGVSWQEYADRRTADGTVPHSGWESRAADLRLGLAQGEMADWLFAVQWLEQPDTPRVDELVPGYGQDEPSSQLYSFQPNSRGFLHARYRRDTGIAWMERMEVHLARQRVVDDRVTQDYGSTVLNHEQNDSTLDGLTVQFLGHLAEDWTLAWGAEIYRDTVRSARQATDTVNGVTQDAAPRFPDRSTMDSDAAYATLGWQATGRLELDAGLRYSRFDIFLPASGESPSADLEPDDLTGDLRMLLDLTGTLRLAANVSRGFRPPNVFDLGALGPRPGNRYNVANLALGPETVWSYDLGLKFDSDALQADLFGFMLDYRDRITSVPTGGFTPDGRMIVRSENQAKVRLYGVEGSLRWQPRDDLGVNGVVNWTWGEDEIAGGPDVPADRVPPLNGELGLTWATLGGRLTVDPFLQFSARQDRLSPRDLEDPRINPAGTPGWVTMNLHLGWQLDDRWGLGLNLENLGDQGYREHGSGIDARGRNIGLWLDAAF